MALINHLKTSPYHLQNYPMLRKATFLPPVAWQPRDTCFYNRSQYWWKSQYKNRGRSHAVNTRVKRRACARGLILVARVPITRAKFQRESLEATAVSQNERKKIEILKEMCNRNQNKAKGKLGLLEHKLIEVQVPCWFTILFLSFTKQVTCF